MDDGIIYMKWQPGKTEDQHWQRHRELVCQIFDILEASDLYVKPEKCAFEQDEMEYLGIIVGKARQGWTLRSSWLWPTTWYHKTLQTYEHF
jgi:hypothetical protein